MEFMRKTIRVGNSSGVILPKQLLGSEVRVIVVNQPINIKKEALKLLDDYLPELLGVYIINEKPIEILAISTNIKEIINKNNIKISIVPLSLIRKDITKQGLKDKLLKAKTILNNSLLFELRKEIKS